MWITFSCPAFSIAGYWQRDEFLGGSKGYIYIPLAEFNYINNNKVAHKDGWIYMVPEGDAANVASFRDKTSHSWNVPAIVAEFSEALGKDTGMREGPTFSYGIYINKIDANVPSSSQVISILTSLSGNKFNYRAGGQSPTSKHKSPTITNNSQTLNYTNTVTCSVTSNVSNLDLGTVNVHENINIKPPLATIVLTMKCGLGLGGGNMTSNYPSFIIAGSAKMNSVTSPNATSEWLASTNSVGFRVANGWGLRFKTGDAVNINTLNNISIPIYAYKYGTTQASSADWNGAVTFEISYN